jgi:hypothetical protein
VIPVARKVWQPIAVSMPASAARRRTMKSDRFSLSPFLVSYQESRDENKRNYGSQLPNVAVRLSSIRVREAHSELTR